MAETLHYRIQGRRPAVFGAMAVALMLLALAATADAPLTIWIIWGLAFIALLAAIILNPICGSSIDDEVWMHFSGSRRTELRIDRITQVELTSWSDGPDSCRVRLEDGRVISVPSGRLPDSDALEAALRARGVAVIRR